MVSEDVIVSAVFRLFPNATQFVFDYDCDSQLKIDNTTREPSATFVGSCKLTFNPNKGNTLSTITIDTQAISDNYLAAVQKAKSELYWVIAQ